MTQFDRSDDKGTKRIVSDRDVIIATDRDQDGAGDFVVTTGGVERLRMTAAGVGSGFGAATGGSISVTGTITLSSDSDLNGAGDIVFTLGTITPASFALTTDPDGNKVAELRVGNATSWDPSPDTGTPPGNVFPVKFLHLIGTPGTPVKHTTQALVGWATYKERTLDDSAEAASYGIILTDAYGGFASAQTLPVVGFESDALIQGAVSVTNKVVGLTGGIKIQSTAHADSGMHFYAAQTVIAAGATMTNRYGFYDEGVLGPTLATNTWSFYGKENIQTEKRLIVGAAGAITTGLGQAMITGPNVTGGATDIPSLIVRPGPGQTSPSINVQTNGGLPRIQMFGANGNIQLGIGATGGSGNGLLSMVTSNNPSGIPPTAGVYHYVDTADNKAKVKTTDGQVTTLQHALLDLHIAGLGYKSWSHNPNNNSGATAPTSQTVYVQSMPLRAGQVVTNVVFNVQQQGVGTAPSNIFVGLADSTGKILAKSNDLAASAIWTAGASMAQAALSATYTVLADGLYYAVFLQNGAWGTTQMTLGKNVSNITPGGVGTTVFGTGGTTGQTALPAVNSTIAGGIVTTNGIAYFVAAT